MSGACGTIPCGMWVYVAAAIIVVNLVVVLLLMLASSRLQKFPETAGRDSNLG